jgi:C-terminal processing protease CtpA/Prc
MMFRSSWVRMLVLALIAAVPAVAGEYGKKCTENTQDCLDHMASKMKSGGWVGVEMDVDETTGALTVTKVIPGSPAEAAGIQTKDVLYALNGVRIAKDNDEALRKARQDWKPGQAVTYTIKRDGTDRQVTLTLAPMPADVLARYVGQHMLEHANSEVASK